MILASFCKVSLCLPFIRHRYRSEPSLAADKHAEE